MGEYATDKRTGERFKIGTCECMYYVRYEQRNMFKYDYPMDNFFWRIPTPDEDNIGMGEYDYPLFYDNDFIPLNLRIDSAKIDKESVEVMKESNGTLQLSDSRMGLFLNVRCPHGLLIGKNGDEGIVRGKNGEIVFSYGYNGHSDTLYLKSLKNTEKDLMVSAECRCCGDSWSFTFPEIEPAIVSLWMKLRLLHQCSDYWYKHNGSDKPFNTEVKSVDYLNHELVIKPIGYHFFLVTSDGEQVCSGSWTKCRNTFIQLLPRAVEVTVDERRIYVYANRRRAAFWGEKMCKRYLPELNIKESRLCE